MLQTQTGQVGKTKTLNERKDLQGRVSIASTPPSSARWSPLFLSRSREAAGQLRGGESWEATAPAPGAGSPRRVRGCQRSREADVGAWGYDASARMARCQGHWPLVVINQYGAGGEVGKERQAPSGTQGRERQRQPAVPAAAAAKAAAVATGELSE